MVSNNKFKDLEKELVAEQPGLAVSVTGLIIALFIGLSIRTALAPERVLHLVEKAAANIDSHFVPHVGRAGVSLADGIFPELAVVVKDLSLESDEVCWMRPSLEVNQVKLPIDFFKLLRGKIHIHEILADEVSLSLRSDLSACKKTVNTASETGSAESAMIRQVAATANEPSAAWQSFTHSRDSIDSVQIDRVRIHYLPLTFTSFEVRHLDVGIGSKDPKKIQINGILNLNGETLSGDYASTAFLKLDYEEQRKPDWHLSVDGHWREGRYLLNTDFDSHGQYVKVNTDMDQIPLNQLFPLLRKYHLLTSDFNGRQVWLTLKGGFEGPVAGLSKVPAKFELIRIEGNIGEIEARNFEVERLDPFLFKPIDVDIKSLQLDSLMTFLNRTHLNPILGHLGVFHGKAHFEDSQNVKIKGENTGLEFVFSSRSVRQAQPISLIAGELNFQQSHWNLKIDRIKPVEGVFLGDLHVDADHDWSKVSIKAKIDELTLGPTVQKLITNGGEVGSIVGEMQCRFERGGIEDISGNFTTNALSMDQLNIKRSKISMSTKNKEVSVDVRVQGVGVGKDSPVHSFLAQFHSSSGASAAADTAAGFGSVRLKTRMLDDFHWENLNLQLGKETLSSEGGWDHSGRLEGDIRFFELGKIRHYKIGGFRDHPNIDPVQ